MGDRLTSSRPVRGIKLNRPFSRLLAGFRPRTPGLARLLGLAALLSFLAGVELTQASPPEPAKTAAGKTASSKTVAESPFLKSYGSSNAPIRLDVFTDYQCPSCRAFYEGTLKPLIASDYVTGGKVYIVHHDFPLQAHMYSGIAARWANAAARIGRFPEAEAALYDNQEAWQANGDIAKYIAEAMPPADFRRVEALVKSCESPAPQSSPDKSNPLARDPHPCPFDYAVAEDIELGYKIPIQATPTYVITNKGQKLPAGSGVVSWPILKQFFDSLLSQ
jgi:protein-disulfide isomerase